MAASEVIHFVFAVQLRLGSPSPLCCVFPLLSEITFRPPLTNAAPRTKGALS